MCSIARIKKNVERFTILCQSSLHRSHANLLYIVPILVPVFVEAEATRQFEIQTFYLFLYFFCELSIISTSTDYKESRQHSQIPDYINDMTISKQLATADSSSTIREDLTVSSRLNSTIISATWNKSKKINFVIIFGY